MVKKTAVIFILIILLLSGCEWLGMVPPDVPTNVAIGDITTNSLTIGWNKAAHATGYRVFRSTSAGGPFTNVSREITDTSYSDSGLAPGTEYWYKVEAYNRWGESMSSVISAVTLAEEADETAPEPGGSGIITVSDITATTLSLSWVKAEDETTEQSDLQYLAYISESELMDTVEGVEGNGTALGDWLTDIDGIDVDGLVSEVTYYFNVIVKDEAGNKAVYVKASATTLEDLPLGEWGDNWNEFKWQ